MRIMTFSLILIASLMGGPAVELAMAVSNIRAATASSPTRSGPSACLAGEVYMKLKANNGTYFEACVKRACVRPNYHNNTLGC